MCGAKKFRRRKYLLLDWALLQADVRFKFMLSGVTLAMELEDEYVGHRVDDGEYCPRRGEPSFSAWLQFQNVSIVFLPRHEYTYANTEMDIDSDIFVLDTPAECMLTSSRDVWPRGVLKRTWWMRLGS